jgi:hypothetical protein
MTNSIEHGGDRRLARRVDDSIELSVQAEVASWTDVLIKILLA